MGYSNSEYQTSQPDLKNTFRTAQMKKLFHLIQNNNPSQDITTLDNLDELIKSALGNDRKKLVNEEKFYRFLFEHGLSHFVKNKRAIDLYYDHKDSWWEVWLHSPSLNISKKLYYVSVPCQPLNMAQYPLLSVVSKIDHIQKDLLEIEQTLAMLLKVIFNMKSKQLSHRADVAKDKIFNANALLQSIHHVDDLLLKICNFLSQCEKHSAFIQRLLKMRTYQFPEV